MTLCAAIKLNNSDKSINGIGNNIDTFHKSSSRQIHSNVTVHLHNTVTTHNFPQM